MRRVEHGAKSQRAVFVGVDRSATRGNCSIGLAPRQALAVKWTGVRLERSRSFGAVWLGLKLWQALRLDEVLAELLPRSREAVSWAEVIALLVIARLCEPSSELYVAEKWYRTTALEDLLGVWAESIYDERLYRALDRLLPHKEAIEKQLVKRLGELLSWTTIFCSTMSRAAILKGS